MNMPVDGWEDELMFYTKKNYLDAFYDNIMSTFGILEQCILDDNFYPYRIQRCNCLMKYKGPYFELILLMDLEICDVCHYP